MLVIMLACGSTFFFFFDLGWGGERGGNFFTSPRRVVLIALYGLICSATTLITLPGETL